MRERCELGLERDSWFHSCQQQTLINSKDLSIFLSLSIIRWRYTTEVFWSAKMWQLLLWLSFWTWLTIPGYLHLNSNSFFFSFFSMVIHFFSIPSLPFCWPFTDTHSTQRFRLLPILDQNHGRYCRYTLTDKRGKKYLESKWKWRTRCNQRRGRERYQWGAHWEKNV